MIESPYMPPSLYFPLRWVTLFQQRNIQARNILMITGSEKSSPHLTFPDILLGSRFATYSSPSEKIPPPQSSAYCKVL